MHIKDLVGLVPEEVVESLGRRNISVLTPPQASAIEYGLMQGKNFVVVAPTASGKTLIAEFAMAKTIIWDKKKTVYIAPMRALVREKYAEFKEAYPFIKSAISIGDLDSLDRWLQDYDAVFVSTEKIDSLIRHGLQWLGEIGCIIVDEIHMLDDPGRGPTLEILISKLRRLCPKSQFIALSATVGNSKEIAEWMGAELITSNYRPVALERGIELEGSLFMDNFNEEKLESASRLPELRIAEDTLKKSKQILIFYSTKRNVEAGAERLSELTAKYLSESDRSYLTLLSKEILGALNRPTLQCEKLARLVSKGVAFHHSGLVNEQRELVEDAFRNNRIKAICSTTTLGLGINLPAHTVLVRDLSRYGDYGNDYISVNEITQLFGRAGRPKYDKSGRALIIARSKSDMQEQYNRYILAEPDPVMSKLGILPILRTHVLAFVATRFLTSEESIMEFMKSTFYGYQYANMLELRDIIMSILAELHSWGFVEKKGSVYNATKLGYRISELYIDPLSAKWMIDSLPRISDDISILFMISNTIEMRPYVKVTEDAETRYFEYQYLVENNVPEISSKQMFYDPIKPFSTALMLNDWASERGEREIISQYKTTPGALFSKISNADWLLFASSEIAKILRYNSLKFLEMRIRIKYGIKKELMDLIRLEQVGRVRARMMFNRGIKKANDIRRPENQNTITEMFGKEIAGKIISQMLEPEK